MTIFTRRKFTSGIMTLSVLGGCTNANNANNTHDDSRTQMSEEDIIAQKKEIDKRTKVAEAYLYENISGAAELYKKSVGVLIIPLITEASIFYGGAFGRGVLKTKREILGYYAAAKGSIGLQFGIHQYAHALFFLTDRSLQRFYTNQGSFTVGTDLTYAIKKEGGSIGIDTESGLSPIVAVVFAQSGFVLGVSLEGIKYTRLYL